MDKLDNYQLALFNCFTLEKDTLSKELNEKLVDASNIFLYRILPFIKMKEINISILGTAKSGKTTFIKRLKGEHFNPSYIPTTGIVTHVIERYNYRINIHDYAGQEMYIHRNNLCNHKIDGVIFMYEANSKLSYYHGVSWYKEKIKNFENIPLIVVKNKVDVIKDTHDCGYQNKISTKKSCWNISSKNMNGVNEMFEYLLQQY